MFHTFMIGPDYQSSINSCATENFGFIFIGNHFKTLSENNFLLNTHWLLLVSFHMLFALKLLSASLCLLFWKRKNRITKNKVFYSQE